MLACSAATPARGEGRIAPGTGTFESARGLDARRWAVVLAAHGAAVYWFFGGTVLGGQLPFFRDLSSFYAPSYAFAADALRQGVWPLWNPTVNAGEPFLLAYPVDLALLLAGGWPAALGLGSALHLLLALAGGTVLARRLGMGPWGAWLAGLVYGAGGLVLSLANLLQLFQAAAWAPWVIAAFLAAARHPTPRRVAALALLAALQVSTLGGDVLVQTAIAGLVLLEEPAPLRDRRLPRLVVGAILALLLAAPALLGTRALLEGTSRAHGFAKSEALAFSLHPAVLGEVLLPKLLGDPHGFSDADYWGRAYFPEGYPYFVSLYIGLPVLLLAGGARGRRRLWLLAAAAVALSLGAQGPLGLLPDTIRLPFRGPQKLFFLAHLSLALLAGFGLERRLFEKPPSRARFLFALPGLAWLGAVLALRVDPAAVRSVLAVALPPLADPRGLVAADGLWPAAWLPSASLALAAGLALALGGAWSRAAALVVALDLAVANGGVAPLAPASFYHLRPEVASLVRGRAGPSRWFSYGVAYTPGLRFTPLGARAPSDAWLYYLDRQSLLPRTPVLDGLEVGVDVDRTGSAPPGAALAVEETMPSRFEGHHTALRLANVRWVLSFEPLPDALVARRGEARFPEIESPLGLYEVRDALPRAWFQAAAASAPPAPGEAEVVYEALDPHTVRLTARTPPGQLVVLDGHHPDWTAEDRSGPVPIQPVFGRYRAVRTRGGTADITFRFEPAWRLPALLLSALGGLGALALVFRR